MPSSVSIKLQGASGLLNKVRLLAPRTREAAKVAVAETALLIESDAKEFVPVDTGRLRSTIRAEIAPNGLSSTVEAATNYAVYVEFGTSRQQAQPFLGPAFEKNRQAFREALKRAGLSVK